MYTLSKANFRDDLSRARARAMIYSWRREVARFAGVERQLPLDTTSVGSLLPNSNLNHRFIIHRHSSLRLFTRFPLHHCSFVAVFSPGRDNTKTVPASIAQRSCAIGFSNNATFTTRRDHDHRSHYPVFHPPTYDPRSIEHFSRKFTHPHPPRLSLLTQTQCVLHLRCFGSLGMRRYLVDPRGLLDLTE